MNNLKSDTYLIINTSFLKQIFISSSSKFPNLSMSLALYYAISKAKNFQYEIFLTQTIKLRPSNLAVPLHIYFHGELQFTMVGGLSL